jgi:Zn-dependent peptidase ImmA (M78 family)
MHPGASKLRSDFPPTANKLKPFGSAEWQANKFASLFLMPIHVAREFTSPAQISESCQVSLQAAQIRFSESGIRKRLPACIVEAIDTINGT